MEKLVNKTVKLKLVGLDGNAFSLMGAFSGAAKREGWSKEEIQTVIDAAMSGDYENLLATLAVHCENPVESRDFEDEFEDDFDSDGL